LLPIPRITSDNAVIDQRKGLLKGKRSSFSGASNLPLLANMDRRKSLSTQDLQSSPNQKKHRKSISFKFPADTNKEKEGQEADNKEDPFFSP